MPGHDKKCVRECCAGRRLPFVGVGKLQVRRMLTHENIRLQGNFNSTRVLNELAHCHHVLATVVAQQLRL